MPKLKISLILTFLLFSGMLQAHETFKSLSSLHYFVPNQGQLKDLNGKEVSDVKYIFNNGNFRILFSEHSFAYEFIKAERQYPFSESGGIDKKSPQIQLAPVQLETVKMEVSFANASKESKVFAIEKGMKFNYKDQYGSKELQGYNKLIYKNIYPNIDLEFSFDHQNVKYDIILHPGSNMKSLQMVYNGFGEMTKQGEKINWNHNLGYVSESIPKSYEINGNEVAVNYIVEGNTVRFKAKEYDKNKTLVIDPVIAWGTYFGGNGSDQITAATKDSSGNLYFTGITNSYSKIATKGSYQSTYGGGYYDAFVLKMDKDGMPVWCTYYGGSNVDGGYAITINKTGDIYIGGLTLSINGIASSNAYQTDYTDAYDVFVAKFNNKGAWVWGTYFGADADDYVNAIATDNGNGLYFGGNTSSDGISAGNAYKKTKGGLSDFYVTKMDTSGKMIWASYYGGEANDYYSTFAFDTLGYIYVAGFTQSTTGIASANAFQKKYVGKDDGCLMRLDTSGKVLWGTYYGSLEMDRINSIAIDKNRGIYVAGVTESKNLIATTDGYQNVKRGGKDAFLVKFDTTGLREWGTFLGGKYDDEAVSVRTDTFGWIYIAGNTLSDSGLVTKNALQSKISKYQDAFMARFDAKGKPHYISYYGGTGYDYGIETVSANNNVYFIGYTTSNSGITTKGSYQEMNGGADDGFVVKLLKRDLAPIAVLPANVCYVGKNISPAVVVKNTGNSVISNVGVMLKFLGTPGKVFKDSLIKSLQPGETDTLIFKDTLGIKGDNIYKYQVYLLQADDDAANDTLTEAIRVYAPPVATFTYKVNGLVVDFEPDFLYEKSYIWDFGNGDTSHQLKPTRTYTAKGDYIVKLTVITKLGCTNTFIDTIKIDNTGITEFSINGFKMYPNPITGNVLNLQTAASNNYQLRLTDVSGRMILQKNIYGNKDIQIHIPETLSNGIYFLQLSGGQINHREKIIIQR